MRRSRAARGAILWPVLFPALLAVLQGGCTTTTTTTTTTAKPDAVTPSKEWYVVMPSKDGHRGSIVVNRDGTETVLEGPYRSTRSGTTGAFTADEREVAQTFGAALRAMPPRPATFTLHFVNGRDDFTRDSRAQFPAIAAEMTRRPAPQITIIGHTDTTGSHAHNDALSLRRAERMRAELIKLGIDASRMTMQARGKREPLVPTPDNRPEPRNRRVEVEVR